jgi:hypothetical protein
MFIPAGVFGAGPEREGDGAFAFAPEDFTAVSNGGSDSANKSCRVMPGIFRVTG